MPGTAPWTATDSATPQNPRARPPYHGSPLWAKTVPPTARSADSTSVLSDGSGVGMMCLDLSLFLILVTFFAMSAYFSMDSQQNNTSPAAIQDQTSRQAEMFANRIAKNYKHLKKWAKSAGVECFRVYDRDIPELPFALDLYSDRAHLQEYRKPVMELRGQRHWLTAMHKAAAQALNIALERVTLKQRHGQRPDDQYRKLAASAQDFVVREGGYRFIANLTDHLDSGLFLDHRETRTLVGRLAAGRRVLNLFCYTGSFSVYAAKGNAASTTSVDLSKTYLEWARRNFELNGLD